MSVAILDTPVVRSAALNYTPTAGSKWAIVYVARRNPAGSAQAPTSVTLGGVSMSLVAGVAGLTQTRCASTVWAINEAQIALMSGNAIVVTGGSGTIVVTTMSIQGNPRQTLPSSNGYVPSGSSTTTRSISVSSAADDFLLAVQHWNLVGSAVTMTPTRVFSASDGGSTHSVTYITEPSSRSSTSWTSGNVSEGSAYLAVVFEAVPAIDINTINGSAFGAVKAGSTGNTVTTTSSFTPTSGTHGGKAISAIAGSAGSYTFTSAAYVDGATFPEPDTSQTFALTDGVSTPTASSVYSSPDGMSSVVIVSPETIDNTYLTEAIAGIANPDRIVFPTEDGDFSIAANGKITCVTAGARVLWWWDASSGVMTQLNVTINEVGAIVSAVSKQMPSLAIGYGIGI